MKILTVFGTRPEVIKLAPVITEIRKNSDKLACSVCVTGQHRQMTQRLIELFGIKIDYDLDIMAENQTLEHIAVSVLTRMKEIISREKPDFLMVQGDTSTAMAAALAAFYQKVRVIHVEAGLRTSNKLQPYPEEVNRRIIDSLSDLYFAHTASAKDNLVREGVPEENIEITGNTVIDALLDVAGRDPDPGSFVPQHAPLNGEKIILVTAHRRESFGEPFRDICYALKDIASRYNNMRIIYPVHLNPNVQKPVREILGSMENISLVEPLDYLPFVHLMKRSYIILTDSGGVQEEAPSLGIPVLVLRQTTERPEAVTAGTVEIIGTQREKIVSAASELIDNSDKYNRMSRAINPYGDGKASQRIIARLLKENA
ncbi:MAG: UDP-N-acetylglucosamine 2-epimerase (non-hydrolyzing) [Candidatus Omnitrophica bacterium]|nr:UDP-N-acetylglucosamine 2-epimerase (non-hydrolyzing) [Candidatus Omnitrophota bacterium]MDD5552970.1 UDP-N-acetylglucosamine 2-epimerase (non-hydrolyzing) [Candidatus Omnitrophota bacterium]